MLQLFFCARDGCLGPCLLRVYISVVVLQFCFPLGISVCLMKYLLAGIARSRRWQSPTSKHYKPMIPGQGKRRDIRTPAWITHKPRYAQSTKIERQLLSTVLGDAFVLCSFSPLRLPPPNWKQKWSDKVLLGILTLWRTNILFPKGYYSPDPYHCNVHLAGLLLQELGKHWFHAGIPWTFSNRLSTA